MSNAERAHLCYSLNGRMAEQENNILVLQQLLGSKDEIEWMRSGDIHLQKTTMENYNLALEGKNASATMPRNAMYDIAIDPIYIT